MCLIFQPWCISYSEQSVQNPHEYEMEYHADKLIITQKEATSEMAGWLDKLFCFNIQWDNEPSSKMVIREKQGISHTKAVALGDNTF